MSEDSGICMFLKRGFVFAKSITELNPLLFSDYSHASTDVYTRSRDMRRWASDEKGQGEKRGVGGL